MSGRGDKKTARRRSGQRAATREPSPPPVGAEPADTADAEAAAEEAEVEVEVEEAELDVDEGGADAAPLPRVVAVSELDEPDEKEKPDGRALVAFDPLQRYLMEIRRYPLLSREEERELAIRYKEHEDIQAAYKLVTGNLRLVVMIAREYQRAARNLLDLIQEGNIGLMEAVKKFDPHRGIRFPSYAVWWVRAYIIRYLINNWRVVKLGTTQAQRKLFFNLQKEKDRLEREGIFPGPRLIAQRLDVKESEVVEMEQRLASRDLSIDQPSDEEGGGTLLDVLPSGGQTTEDQVADAEFRLEVNEKIRAFGEGLKDKEAVIFSERLLSETPLTLQQIGDKYGISRERVRQIEERLKKRLRVYLESEMQDLRESVLDLD
jgi:RNA polymerase sigma-32 factor